LTPVIVESYQNAKDTQRGVRLDKTGKKAAMCEKIKREKR